MNRLVSLDFFRGMTIILMIIVNSPGSWTYVYPPLRHADWHGVTPTDLVFPFFLYIVGVSIALAYARYKIVQEGSQALPSIAGSVYIKIAKRTVIIFLLGLFLALFPEFDFSSLRIAGVLQRIALVFGICAVLYLKTSWRTQLYIGIGCLLGYYVVMCFVPFGQSMAGTLEPGDNFAAWIDGYITPGRLYRETWDPEGLFSTIPALGNGIAGMLTGRLLLDQGMDRVSKIVWLFVGGLLSFSAAMFLALSIWIIDEKGYKRWTHIGVVFGMNAITTYVLHGVIWRLFRIPLIDDMGIQELWMSGGIDVGLAPKLVSLSWAVVYMLLIYLIAWWMYRRKLFIKV